MGVGEAAADFQLRTGRMPLASRKAQAEPGRPAYSSSTIRALVQYVGTFGAGPGLPKVRPGDMQAGQSIFAYDCAPCHSSSGTGVILTEGTRAPPLWDTPTRQIAEAVRLGPGPMPAFAASDLDGKELNDVVTYVQQLGGKQVRGGLGLDQYGPIVEGIFAWFVLVPLLVVVIVLIGKRAPR